MSDYYVVIDEDGNERLGLYSTPEAAAASLGLWREREPGQKFRLIPFRGGGRNHLAAMDSVPDPLAEVAK